MICEPQKEGGTMLQRAALVLLLRTFVGGLGVMLWAGNSSAQTAKDLVGAWNTVSIVSEHDGKKVALFGSNVKGIQIFDASGRFAIIAMRGDMPKVASNNRQTATAEEALQIQRGTIAYFGTWTANDADKTLIVNIEADTFPNFVGTTQKRRFEISGDQLTITNPTGASGGVLTVVLERAK
jgi:hypothetical protein